LAFKTAQTEYPRTAGTTKAITSTLATPVNHHNSTIEETTRLTFLVLQRSTAGRSLAQREEGVVVMAVALRLETMPATIQGLYLEGLQRVVIRLSLRLRLYMGANSNHD